MFEHKCNNESGQNSKGQCECKNAQGLFLPVRQVSWVVASIILVNFCLFIGGYFWGQKSAITTFSNKLEQESFGDQIYSSMCGLCDSQGEIEEVAEPEEDGQTERSHIAQDQKPTLTSDQSTLAQTIEPSKADACIIEGTQTPESDRLCNGEANQDEEQNAQYFAQLVGFGTARAAQQFAHRLSLKEIPVIVRKRQSRTARGRFISWYQVVTEKFDNRNELEAIIEKIKGEEKLNDVNIVTC